MTSANATQRPKNTMFANVSGSLFDDYAAFAAENPKILSTAQVLEKFMIMDFVLPLLKNQFAGGKILEIGCGSGVHSALLTNLGDVSATELKSTVFWLGDDIDQNRSTVFETLAKTPIQFRYNDGRSLPFEDESFDLIFHNSVIEHVPDIVAFNLESLRVLRPGGLCICITGTPALCRFRYGKFYLLRLPLIAAYGLLVVARDKFRSSKGAKTDKAAISAWHFQRTTERLEAIVNDLYSGPQKASSISVREIRKMYAGLRHFIREPEYNQILIENLAARHGVTPRGLILQLVEHFKSPWNDLKFRLTPSTHSQHTANFRTEIKEWRIENWVKSFTDATYQVETVAGYRYQHLLDLTFSERANAWLTYYALPLVRVAARWLPPRFASEIILLARRPKAKMDSPR